jgi:hypothetical protein
MSLVRINRNPSPRHLAVFGLAWLAFLALLGWESWRRGRHPAAEAAWGLGVAVPLVGLALPRFLRLVYLALSFLTYPIGVAVSYTVLTLVYTLALTPIGLTMRLLGHDPLSRRFDPAARTYWKPRIGAKSVEDYFRQS